MTSSKVDSTIRDRLAETARAGGQTKGALLATVVDTLGTEPRRIEDEAARGRLRREVPIEWREYLDELADWDAVGGMAADWAWPPRTPSGC